MGGYVPRILLCGDIDSFRQAANMDVEIVGQISFTGAIERGENYVFANPKDLEIYVPGEIRIFLNGAEISADDLRKILNGTADYIVFDDAEIIGRHNELYYLKIAEQAIPRETLFRQARRQFYSYSNFLTLTKILRDEKFSTLLDVDAAFAETDLFLFDWITAAVDAVGKNLEPIHENFYRKIYATPADCRFKFYDALLMIERTPADFIDAVLATNDLSDVIVTFARKNTALESWLTGNENIFEKISVTPAVNGNWYVIRKRTAKDFCVYVVTHKDAKLDALPEGYQIIHAGHAIAKENFGYLADDTGDNISALNLYLNEVTALYWMWKHTSHAIIGLNHYRRFFIESNDTTFAVEKILSREAAEKILHDFDIIVAENDLSRLPVSYWHMMLSDVELERFVNKIFREHIARKQPDYLAAFDHVADAYTGFQYEIFITRRNVMDAYCEWLFSFLLDVTAEIFARTNIKQIDNPRKYRIISFFAERLLTVWLWKNPLRIKKLPVLFREDI